MKTSSDSNNNNNNNTTSNSNSNSTTNPTDGTTNPSGHTVKVAELVKQDAMDLAARLKAQTSNAVAVFLTKEQRQELALKKLAEQRKAEAAEKQQLDQQRLVLMHHESRVEESRRKRQREKDEREKERQSRAEAREEEKASSTKEQEQKAIMDTYLGRKIPKKRVIPPSQKFKLSFDWDGSEDTSADLNPLYASRHQLSLMYGRGFIAGVDRREQLKKNTFYRDLSESRGGSSTKDLISEEKLVAQENRKQRKLDAEAKVHRHWREKALNEMEDRDWRIFREDFDISTSGAAPLPIRLVGLFLLCSFFFFWMCILTELSFFQVLG